VSEGAGSGAGAGAVVVGVVGAAGVVSCSASGEACPDGVASSVLPFVDAPPPLQNVVRPAPLPTEPPLTRSTVVIAATATTNAIAAVTATALSATRRRDRAGRAVAPVPARALCL
jgi:hypothetical protein